MLGFDVNFINETPLLERRWTKDTIRGEVLIYKCNINNSNDAKE